MKKILITMMMVVLGLMATPVMAIDPSAFNPNCDQLDANQKIEAGCGLEGSESTGRVVSIIDVAVGLTGLVAVVVIVIGGQRYLSSAGETGRLKQAKDMIMYGVIGLIVAILAWAIVNFLISSNIFKV